MAVNHQEIADRIGLARSTVTKILNQLPRNRANAETIKRVFKTAREMGYDFSRLRNIHRRRADRRLVSLPVGLKIFYRDNSLYDVGVAKVINLSPFGALLGSIVTKKKSLPLSPFHMGLAFSNEVLSSLDLQCQVVRIMSGRKIEIGVNFMHIKGSDEKVIIDYLNS
jgi:transcriptional regulator with XRE-family HTH domain